jgi:transcriptional regulator with GAF, ATPase, and Fis domain
VLGPDFAPSYPAPRPATAGPLEDAQRRQIETVLERTGWRIEGDHGAAKALGLQPSTLRSRMTKLGIMRG